MAAGILYVGFDSEAEPRTFMGVTSTVIHCDFSRGTLQEHLERTQRVAPFARPASLLALLSVWAADCRGYYAHASGRVVTQWPHDMDEYLARTGTLRPECYESAPAGGGARL